jgi:hypothetical protein
VSAVVQATSSWGYSYGTGAICLADSAAFLLRALAYTLGGVAGGEWGVTGDPRQSALDATRNNKLKLTGDAPILASKAAGARCTDGRTVCGNAGAWGFIYLHRLSTQSKLGGRGRGRLTKDVKIPLTMFAGNGNG